MSDLQRRAGAFRRRRNDIENHIVDEYVAGRIDRREFIKRGTVAGLSLPMISFLIAACGGANDSATTTRPPRQHRRRRRDVGRSAAPRAARSASASRRRPPRSTRS